MAKRGGGTRSTGSSGASASRTTTPVSGGGIETAKESMTPEQRLADVSVKLTSSDMKWIESLDEETNEQLGRSDMKRWDIPNVPYNGGRAYATITQFLDRPGGRVAGYEIYFDKAGSVGEARTLSEAKEKLIRYINTKRG